MASTSPFPQADGLPFRRRRARRRLRGAQPVETGPAIGASADDKPSAGSSAVRGSRAARRAASIRHSANTRGEAQIGGFPAWAGLQPVLLFLLAPSLLIIAIVVSGVEWDRLLLYSIALVLGAWVFVSSLRDVELVLACILFYLPFSTTFAVPIAPGLNGTNMLLLLGLFASVLSAFDKQRGWVAWPPGTSIVVLFAILSILSGPTLVLTQPGGYAWLMYNELLNYKGWIDQFILYFIVASCVRDVDTAKRLVIYMAMGSIVVVLYSVPEMFDKMSRSTIEKSRIVGPHQQSNNFGGFVAYTLMPLLAYFTVNIRTLRAWLLTPYFLIAAKVLISTFSRGAYLAMALGGIMAGFLKGKGFLAFWAVFALSFFLVFPQLLPQSIVVRLNSITESSANSSAPAELDKSSTDRLILWRAAGKMILDDPLLGQGYKGFKKNKAQYTDQPVVVSDPHNMYLFIGANMGLPALSLFLLLLGYSFWLGRRLSQHREDRFVRVIGIGGASATACYAVICLFGSRAVNVEFTAYFWTYLVVMQVIFKHEIDHLAASRVRRTRRTAFGASKKALETTPAALDNDVSSASGVRASRSRRRGARAPGERGTVPGDS